MYSTSISLFMILLLLISDIPSSKGHTIRHTVQQCDLNANPSSLQFESLPQPDSSKGELAIKLVLCHHIYTVSAP